MDPMEKMDPESHEWGFAGRKFFAQKMWAATAAKPFLAEHLLSLQKYPPRQAADTLSLHKGLEMAMAKLEQPGASSN
jgi:arylsulfatase